MKVPSKGNHETLTTTIPL